MCSIHHWDVNYASCLWCCHHTSTLFNKKKGVHLIQLFPFFKLADYFLLLVPGARSGTIILHYYVYAMLKKIKTYLIVCIYANLWIRNARSSPYLLGLISETFKWWRHVPSSIGYVVKTFVCCKYFTNWGNIFQN